MDIAPDLLSLLRMAQHNEMEEHDDVYKRFGDQAKEEGFEAIAHSFQMIGEVEKVHGERFGRFARWIEEGKLYVSEVKTGWICLNCGYICETTKAPELLPVLPSRAGILCAAGAGPFTAC